MSAHLRKRSLILSGHDTSVALEPEFWQVLDTLAQQKRLPLPTLVAKIDAARIPTQSLASALRVYALKSLLPPENEQPSS